MRDKEFDVAESKWTPIERVPNHGKRQYWLMKCECGAEREVRYAAYLEGTSRSCGRCFYPQEKFEFDVTTSRWTPIERVGDRTGRHGAKEAYWLMICTCGVEREVSWKNYIKGRSRSCGCYRREVSKGLRMDSRKLAPGESARNNLILIYKKGATRRGYSYELTTEQFVELTSSNCSYCGRPPNRSHLPVALGIYGAYQYNGIDRKDNTIGYVLENCIPACTECNRAKNTMSYDEFISYLDSLVAFRNTL